jgi:ATP-dependent 26S proteasome regulatory subunit
MGMTANQLALVRAVAKNNLQKAKTAALACCTEDGTQKNHHAVAYAKRFLTANSLNMIELPPNISGFSTMEDLTNTYIEERYYITEEEQKLYELIRDMNNVALTLMEKRIPYLNATLLYGESGVGKTEFSRYCAYKLGLPYLYVNLSRMMDSLLGGTAKNLTALFTFISQQKCVVMLDEIDSLAVKRKYADSSAGAEISRSTTCLLQLLDCVTNDHVLIAATNLIDSIDPAVRRRFTEQHELHRLSSDDRERFLMQYMDDAGFQYDMDALRAYAAQDQSQAELMTHMTRCIARSLIEQSDRVVL